MGFDQCIFEFSILTNQSFNGQFDLFFLSLKLFSYEGVLVFEYGHHGNSLLVLISDLLILSLELFYFLLEFVYLTCLDLQLFFKALL